MGVIALMYLFSGFKPEGFTGNSLLSDKSIAVLAFNDMSPDGDQEYFCDGISEEIINNLVQIKELKVIGRSSSFQFKGQNPDHRVVGEKLGVSTFLEGSIRKYGNKIRVTAQLINVDDGSHIWSKTFDRDLDDIFKIQDEISQNIARQLKVSFGLSKTKEVNLDIYDIYLQAKTLLNQRGEAVDRAITLFEDILELDSTYQPAWTGLAQAWTVNSLYKVSSSEESHGLIFKQSLDLAENAARRALQLEPEDPESLAAMATIYRDRGQWGIAYDYYKRAYSLNGKSPIILEDYVQFLSAVGYVTKSLELSNILIALDPLTPLYITWHGNTLRLNKELQASIKTYKKSIEVDPNFLFSAVGALKIYLQYDRLDSALDLVNNSLAFSQARKINYSVQIKAELEKDFTFDFSQIPPELRLIHPIIALDRKDVLMETHKSKAPGSTIFGFSYWDIYNAIIYGYANDPWFKELIIDSGLVEFWKENGWPAYCKPVGDNDFVWE